MEIYLETLPTSITQYNLQHISSCYQCFSPIEIGTSHAGDGLESGNDDS